MFHFSYSKQINRMHISGANRTGFGTFQASQTGMMSGNLDMFQKEMIETGVKMRKECIVRPNAVPEAGPVQIHIPPEGNYFIDTTSMRVNMDFKIEKRTAAGAWTALDETDKVAPVNLFGKSIFKDVEVWLNSKQISLVASTAYHLKAYLETLSSFGVDASKGHLEASFWKPDTAGKEDTHDVNNLGWRDRAEFIKESKMVQTTDPLHTELATLDKYMLPGVTIDLRFSLNEPNMFLMSAGTDTYRLKFTDFFLLFDRIEVEESLRLRLEAELEKGERAIYGMGRGTIRTKQIASGETFANWAGAYTGRLPNSIMIGMMSSKAYNGDYTTNPFNFPDFNIDTIQIRVNSMTLPCTPLTLKDDKRRAYRHFFDNVGIYGGNSPALLTFCLLYTSPSPRDRG